MKRLGKFLRLSSTEQRLFVRAALLLAGVRVGLWLLPFEILRRHLTRTGQAAAQSMQPVSVSPEKIAWALTVASRYVPGAGSCLVQALAAQVLLERQGHPASLHIGVAKAEENQFEAHAWVESQGKVVVGGEELERYTRLVAS